MFPDNVVLRKELESVGATFTAEMADAIENRNRSEEYRQVFIVVSCKYRETGNPFQYGCVLAPSQE